MVKRHLLSLNNGREREKESETHKLVKQVEYLWKKKLVRPATTWPVGAEKLSVSLIPFSQPEAG